MTTTTMHFGPEWMRTKHQQPSRPQPQSASPPPTAVNAPPGASTYSALVSPAPTIQPEKRDEVHPFRYSKEDLLRIYKEGGGRGGLGLEVERWEGVVREVGSEPVGLREMDETEKKLFAGSLNSDLRRRQSTDFLSPLPSSSVGGERTRLNHNNPTTVSPLRERFGSLIRRKDGADQPSLTIPRRTSLSSASVPLASPRDNGQPSPRTRIPFTPGFDGVLNGGDSWAARRRLSEGLPRSGGVKGDPGAGESQQESKKLNIKEEEEEEEEEGHKDLDPGSSVLDVPDNVSRPKSPSRPDSSHSLSSDDLSRESPEVQVASTGIHNLSVTAESSTSGPPGKEESGVVATTQDLSGVEWSYLDPQGQVQGPFRADLMQKWHDEGYFSPDLLMKRTHVDAEWIPVRELARRSYGDKIFLSLPGSSVPPGLSRRTDSPRQGFALPADQNTLSEPYQPAPVRSLRTSTLDSYFVSGSNPSESPSSSFSAGRFGDGSPDQAALVGRALNGPYQTLDPPVGTRSATGFAAAPDSASTFAGMRRNTSRDPLVDPSLGIRPSSFGSIPPGGTSSVDSFGFNGSYGSPQTQPWQAPSTNPVNSSFDGIVSNRGTVELDQISSNFAPSPNFGISLPQQVGFENSRGAQEGSFGDSGSAVFSGSDFTAGGNQRDPPHLSRSTVDAEIPSSFNNYVDGYGNAGQNHAYTPSIAYTTSHRFGQHGGNIPSNSPFINPSPHHSSAAPQSPWNSHEPPAVRRPGPFDSIHPTSANTIVTAPITAPHPPPWSRANQGPPAASLPIEASSWLVASQGVIDENWKEAPSSSGLVFHNVGYNNHLLQELTSPGEGAPNVPEVPEQPYQPPSAPPPVTLPVAAPAPVKSRHKPTTQPSQPQVPASKPASSAATVVKNPSPPPPSHLKPAWFTDDDKKKNQPSGISLNLREIQEAEAKKAEARKAAEKERERAARVAAPLPPSSDLPPFTASWGLPTSQAGAARSNPPQKETQTALSSPVLPTPPVWTNTSKAQPTKRTMKEIQEEEERRKKFAVKETTATAAKRVHESTTKAVTSVSVAGGAWTTVGPSGKIPTSAVTPTRPALAPLSSAQSASGSAAPSRANGVSPRPPVGQSAKAAPSTTSRTDDSPAQPSHDFLKWLSDSLKGLNSSVNVEEIMSMLLSFPMDPDQSTIEIISDLIYANSITLDGRRFAAEFVSKRKVDVASRPRGAGAAGTTANPVSIADVVKAQPKAAQPEWGGFKVVNKRKKGGRA